MFEIHGIYVDLLTRMFRRTDTGHLEFGPARSIAPVFGVAAIADWIEFRDYIMEGFVRFYLKASPSINGMLIEIRLTGTNRDQYIPIAVRDYIKWAGLSPHEVGAE